ncbi:hypothetical protein ACA689_004200 [Vibrio vulnificus]|uniref:Uncharacterized protein n=1 Tax=Vibrio vulnificus TaxID=672 RepID=A0AAW4HHH8_VIBVL|nr:hypothetical protein [Vibrio vulnificus]ELA3118074.1 hypothetical protein [Vibrio vulnificus]ELC9718968.1 hypothetical protein [Vibrio vulnificus]ELS0763806.1 hypothetical protein [Vibrio vulnificus]ELV8618657.1 hypothetical protein [Vibrio vulnificus]ELV8768179.1 hypothetical protein [Vibrio vulnificus]
MHHLIKNIENYLGLSWGCSFLNAGLFFVPSFFLVYASYTGPVNFSEYQTMEGTDYNYELIVNYFSVHCLIVWIASVVFLVSNQWLTKTNFNIGFYIGLINILAIPSTLLAFVILTSIVSFT